MKLPSSLLGALAVALTGLGVTGCSDLISLAPKPRPTPKPVPKTSTGENPGGGKGDPAVNGGPDGCPVDAGGNRNQAPCPGCGRG
jgi:hypothetical protein